MPLKWHHFVIKLVVLNDHYTGLLLNFTTYPDKQTQFQMNKERGISDAIVMTLMKSYSGNYIIIESMLVELFERIELVYLPVRL